MNIYVINKSTVLKDSDIQSWLPAFNVYQRQVRTWWPRPTNLIWCDKDHEPAEAWKVIFADSSDQAGALGYHDFTPGGRPISYVFDKDDMQYGYSVTVTATHEIAEMIADPWISELFQISDQYCFAKEIADAVEADQYGYNITVPGFPPVLCSDFVLPNWFIPGSTGRFDYQKVVSQPLEILLDGYMSVLDVTTGSWTQIYGKKASRQLHAQLASVPEKELKTKDQFSRLARYARSRDPIELPI